MSGLLDIVKALKELEGIDISQIQQLITLSNVVKAQEEKGQLLVGATSSPAPELEPLPQGPVVAPPTIQ